MADPHTTLKPPKNQQVADTTGDQQALMGLTFGLLSHADDINQMLEAAKQGGDDAKFRVLRDLADGVAGLLAKTPSDLRREVESLRESASRFSERDARVRALEANVAELEARTERPARDDHVSDWLALTNQAAAKWWLNADRDDPETHPRNSDVSGWLMDRGMSQNVAESAATIIRPKWACIGRRPKR